MSEKRKQKKKAAHGRRVQQITPQAEIEMKLPGEKENISWKSSEWEFFQFNLSWDIVWIFSNQSKMQTE